MILYALYVDAIFSHAIPTYGVLPYSMILATEADTDWNCAL